MPQLKQACRWADGCASSLFSRPYPTRSLRERKGAETANFQKGLRGV